MNKQTQQYAIIGGVVSLAGLVGWKVMTDKRKSAEAKKQQVQQNKPQGNTTMNLLSAGRSAGIKFRSRFASRFGIRGTFGTKAVQKPQGRNYNNSIF